MRSSPLPRCPAAPIVLPTPRPIRSTVMSAADVRLSIIIITWNERENLERCLLSLMDKVDFVRDEVIVIDNGSRDGSAEFVATLPQIRYFPLERNFGVGP